MKGSRPVPGHRRPWWEFNVILLALVLFALVYVRHFTRLSQWRTIAWTGGLLLGWITLGLCGLYVRALLRAALPRRLRMIAYVVVPVLLITLYGTRCCRQARLIEDIWEAGQSNDVTFVHGETLRSFRADKLGARYWSWVTGAEVTSGSLRLPLSRLAELQGLRSLLLHVPGSQLFEISGLDDLEVLALVVEGSADFTPLLDLNRLKVLTIDWYKTVEEPIADEQIETLCALPLAALTIRRDDDGALSSAMLRRLRQAHPRANISALIIADDPQEAATVAFLRSQNLFVHVNESGRVIRIDVHHVDQWTNRDWQRLAELPQLQSLYVRDSQIDNPGIAHLANIGALRKCAFLNCLFSQRAWEGVHTLGQVEELLLSNCSLPDSPAGIAGFDALVAVWLHSDQLSPTLIEWLINLESLQYLNIHIDSLTNEALQEIRKLNGLEVELEQYDPLISRSTEKKLRAALPNCEFSIERSDDQSFESLLYYW